MVVCSGARRGCKIKLLSIMTLVHGVILKLPTVLHCYFRCHPRANGLVHLQNATQFTTVHKPTAPPSQ